MKVKYLGPADHVFVGSYGKHSRGQVKSYPRKFAEELLATSKRQIFEETDERVTAEAEAQAEPEAEQALEEKTVAELTEILQAAGVEVPPKARKAELIEMLKKLEETEPAATEKS